MLRWIGRLPRWVHALGIGLAVAGLVIGLRASGALVRQELGVYDAFLRLTRGADGADPRIVLVEVREQDIAKYGHPLSDEILARVLEALSAHAARAIGVDLYRDRPIPPGEERLREAVLGDSAIIMVEKIGGPDTERVSPPAYVVGSSQVGFSDLKLDPDGYARRGLLAMAGRDSGGLSLSARLALRHLAHERVYPTWVQDPEEISPTLYLGKTPIPRFGPDDGGYVGEDDGGYQFLLDYRRGRPAYARLSVNDVLSGSFEPNAVRDRIVLVGSTAVSVRDSHGTPFGQVYGIELHAAMVSQLLDSALEQASAVRFPQDLLEHLLVALCGIGAALVVIALRSPALLGVTTAVGLGSIVGSGLAAFSAHWWLPVVPEAIAWAGATALCVAYLSFVERAERNRVFDLFGRFLARDVAQQIWKQKDAFMDGGRPRAERAVVTVLMADLQGYTGAAEKLEPPQLMEWVNRYLDDMARVIGAHGGVVNDYAGDGIMANFGVPIQRTSEAEFARDAVAAVECALAMGEEMLRLNARWARDGLPVGRVRVGIHTGDVVIGMVGSADRMKYTALGDTVNTASRLETHDKEGFKEEIGIVFRILVGEPTFRRLGGAFRADGLGEVALRGREERVAVYRIQGRAAGGGIT